MKLKLKSQNTLANATISQFNYVNCMSAN